MSKVGFFTPVSFGDQPKSNTQSWLETVDSYFHLGDKKADIIEERIQGEKSSSFLITTLKVISYFTVIIPVIVLIAKAVSLFIPKQILEERINIPPETIKKIQYIISQIPHRLGKKTKIETIKEIQSIISKISTASSDDEITYDDRNNNLILQLSSAPGLIFKMALPEVELYGDNGYPIQSQRETIESQFARMAATKKNCLVKNLDLVIMPHAELLHVNGMDVIVEEISV